MNEMLTAVPVRHGGNIDEMSNYHGNKIILFLGSNCKRKDDIK